MIFIYYSLLIVCIYLGLGLGLTILFCPKTLRKYILYLAPIIGYSYLTLVGWYCYNLNLGGTDIYAIPILGFPAILLLFVLLKERAKCLMYFKSCLHDRDFLTACAIAFFGFLIISSPILLSNDGLNSITIGNADPPNYAIISRFLKEFPRSGGIGFFTQQNTLLKWHLEESVFGAFLATSFSASLLSLDIYQIQSMTIYVFFGFSIILFYLIARHQFQYNYWGASGVTFLYAINPIIYYTIYHGFQSQIIATSLSLFVLFLNIEAINSCQKFSDYYKYLLFSVLINWATSLTYPHMLPLVYGPIFVYVAWYSLNKRAWRSLVNQCLFLLISLAIMSAFSLHRLKVLINYFFLMGAAQAGWSLPFIAPNELFTGFKAKNNLGEILVSLILSILVIGVIYLGFLQTRKSDIKIFILACSLSLTSYVGYLILSFEYLTPVGLYKGYKAYKLLSFFLPQILLGSLVIFQKSTVNFKAKEVRLFTVLLVTVVIGAYNITSSTVKHHGSITQSLLDLQKIENNPAIKSINLIGPEDSWKNTWQAYFLARKPLYFQTPMFYPNPPGSNLNGEWDLLNSKQFKFSEVVKLNIFKNDPSDSIILNSSYTLKRANTTFWLVFGKGWYDIETNPIWSGSNSQWSLITINSSSLNFPIDLKLAYFPLKLDDRLSIYLNGKKVVDCLNNQVCEAQKLLVLKGKNKLEFRSSLPPSLAYNRGKRPLSYAFSSIEITPSTLPK